MVNFNMNNNMGNNHIGNNMGSNLNDNNDFDYTENGQNHPNFKFSTLVIYKDAMLRVKIYDISIPAVEAYLADHPDKIVLHAPTDAIYNQEPDAEMILSLRRPAEGQSFLHIVVLKDDTYEDLTDLMERYGVSADDFSDTPATGPMQGVGGRRRKHRRTHRKRRTHGKRSTYGKRKTHHRRNKRKQSSKRRAH